MNNKTLKPCPFCGGTAIAVCTRWIVKPYSLIECKTCGASIARVSKAEAVEVWNRRESGWIPVSERLPDKEKPVLLTVENCNGKRFTREGFWIPKRTKIVDTDGNLWDGNEGDYNEETDEYYWSEGFYAMSDMDDMCWSLSADYKIIAWMPLPQPYEVGK